MVMIDKIKNECKISACPFDSKIEEKEKDKMKVYNNLNRELKKIWDIPANVIPIVVGALRMTPKNNGIAENYHLIFCKDPPKFS